MCDRSCDVTRGEENNLITVEWKFFASIPPSEFVIHTTNARDKTSITHKMGKTRALFAATAVASLPVATLGSLGHAEATPRSTTKGLPIAAATSTTGSMYLNIPRGGGEGEDKDPPDAGSSSSKTNNSKKKRRRKKNEKTEQEESSSETKNEKPSQAQAQDEKDSTTRSHRPHSASKDKEKQRDQQPETPTPTLPIVEEILKEDDYYRILGITPTQAQSNPATIKKSYRRRALQTHPDKTNGDRRAFDKVAEAYEILSNDEKRKIYDRHGKKGLHGAGPGHGFPTAEDLFRSFFGSGPDRGPFSPPRRNRTVRYQLEVTLEDLYKGMKSKVAVSSPDGRPISKHVEVNVPRGALSGQSIRLHGVMDFDPEDTPGDLVFSLQQRSHRRFTRKGHDLAVAVTIGLDEALNGTTRTLIHLDGRSLTIASARNSRMIQSGDVHVLKGQGMPKNTMGTEFGDLYVQYTVELPKPSAAASHLTEEERAELGRLIRKMEGRVEPGAPPPDVKFLQPASPSDFGTASGRPEIPMDEEDDDYFSGNPFARGRSSFYYSSGLGSSPFFGMHPEDLFRGAPNTDDENTECRQM